MLASAASKNAGAGFPKTSAVPWLANSSAATNAPASKLSVPSASLKDPVLRKCNQFGAGNQLTKRAIETCIMEGLTGIADHDCAMNAIEIIFEFQGQIWMNEKRGEQSFLANHSRAPRAGVKAHSQ